MAVQQTVYQRMRHAASIQSGMKLSAQDVRQLLSETDCRERAHRDDEERMAAELPPPAPRASRDTDSAASVSEPARRSFGTQR